MAAGSWRYVRKCEAEGKHEHEPVRVSLKRWYMSIESRGEAQRTSSLHVELVSESSSSACSAWQRRSGGELAKVQMHAD